MKQPSVYLKMRVLGAIDTAPGKTRHERVRNVAAMTFLDEDGHGRQFTWRTVQTWFYRYKNHGITGMTPQPRKDKGHVRKVTPEELLEAINAARPHFHNNRTNKHAIYRFCIENNLLQRDRIAPTTFYRFIREYDLLAPDDTDQNKKRLAFSMKFANQLWQADTVVGPFCEVGPSSHSRKPARLIAFLDDASRVLCHGEFFFEENVDTLVKSLRAAFYKRGVPEQLLVDNGSIYCSQEITLICARVGCILRHTAVRDAAAEGKIERFFRRVRDQFLVQKLDLSSLDALKSVIRQALQQLPEKQHLVAAVARTLHTYTNAVKILCEAFRIEFDHSAFLCERKRIEHAFAPNRTGKSLTTVLDDAHLMDLANLRKLRLLFEDFPKNHNLVLIGRPNLLGALELGVNQDIKSRVTHSALTKTLGPDLMRDFILRELDRVGLGHNTFTSAAIDLVVRSADGVLRHARNLGVGCLIEAVRGAKKAIDIDNANRVLMQPHGQKETDLKDY